MGKVQKKFGKGRLDHYYRLAKEKGYRARSSFKILQLNQKYGFFDTPKGKKPKPMCIIDLCAAPGSWCQVATQHCPLNSLIVGVDLAPIKPLPNVITFQSDITTDHCRSQLRGYLKTWKADVVMHDGAPNVGMAWTQDAFTQSELVLQSLKLAVEFLTPGGWFITKVFRSKDYNKLLWVFQQFFEKVEATKPPSSRNVSAEIFVVCRGFKAPKTIDPRLLDPKWVFEEMQEEKSTNQAKIYNPEKKVRQREGYDSESIVLFTERPIMEFIETMDPVNVLAETNKFTWDKHSDSYRTLKTLPQTDAQLMDYCKDLKVLGKKDFRILLKWRQAARKVLGIDKAEEAPEEEVVLTTEEQIAKEIEDLKEESRKKLKRERRKKNEQKQKEIYKLQMNMQAPAELGFDFAEQSGTSFKASALDELKKTSEIPRVLEDDLDADQRPSVYSSSEEESELESIDQSDIDNLEAQLDEMYEDYKLRRGQTAESRAKRRRDKAWGGLDDNEEIEDLSSDEEEAKETLSNRASMFFDDPLFAAIGDEGESSYEADSEDEVEAKPAKAAQPISNTEPSDESESEDDFIKKGLDEDQLAMRMTLAHGLATGKITKHDLENEAYNKLSFRDREGLPSWFIEDEERHSQVMRPITKEAVAALREQQKALNARPIKKVAEAMARKKYKAQQRLEKIRKKSDLINDDATKSERDKAEEIARLMRRAKPKQRPKVTVIAAKGGNKGLKGRPGGVKGKYKMVDGTMKKEQRALRRIKKKRT